MDITIAPGPLHGTVEVIPSKSQAHRILICAAFADKATAIHCRDTNRDIEATVDCLNALGAEIERTEDGYLVNPVTAVPERAVLNCCESGSTLRFMLPIAGALGIDATFQLAGRLPYRPLSPLWEEMERMGCRLSRPTETTLRCQGKLRPGTYRISGNVSSQFITGLLFAAALMEDITKTQILGKLESAPYVEMTLQALSMFGCEIRDLTVPAGKTLHSPGRVIIEGDWSNGAFWLAAKALGSPLEILGLCNDSAQGDRICADLIPKLQELITIDVSNIPDSVPILSVVAACNQGAIFENIQRLRLKESDRVASVIAMVKALGGSAAATESTLRIHGTRLCGGIVDSCNDHRIAMAAAIAATTCREAVTIIGASCVEKSYPKFWEEFIRLGGKYELYLR